MQLTTTSSIRTLRTAIYNAAGVTGPKTLRKRHPFSKDFDLRRRADVIEVAQRLGLLWMDDSLSTYWKRMYEFNQHPAFTLPLSA